MGVGPRMVHRIVSRACFHALASSVATARSDQNVEANILKVRAGLMSPQDLAASQGQDFESVLEAIAQAQKLADDYGVALPAYDALPGATQAAPPNL